jgi:hypothetical protein
MFHHPLCKLEVEVYDGHLKICRIFRVSRRKEKPSRLVQRYCSGFVLTKNFLLPTKWLAATRSFRGSTDLKQIFPSTSESRNISFSFWSYMDRTIMVFGIVDHFSPLFLFTIKKDNFLLSNYFRSVCRLVDKCRRFGGTSLPPSSEQLNLFVISKRS